MKRERGLVEETEIRERGSRGWITVSFLVAAAGISLVFYRDFVFHSDRMLWGTDMVVEGFPLRRFALEELRSGRGLPLWNPFLYGGLPYLATLPGPVFYPTSLLYLLLPLYRAIGWTFVIHTFLAGAFAYFAGRSFGLRRSASSVCGLAFMLSGYVLSTLHGGHDGRMFAMVLIPLVFGMAERGLRGGSAAWYVGLGAAVGLQILTPHVQVMYFSTLALALYAGIRLITLHRERGPDGGGLVRPVLWFTGALCLGAALGAVQLLPTFALLGHVGRAAQEVGYDFAASWSLPPQELSALVLPDLIGSLGSYWGANPFKLHTEFMGGVPIALALVAVIGSFTRDGSREHRNLVWFLAIASLLGICFALGAATPVHRLAYSVVPLVKSFRAPVMMLGPVAFFVALLAGLGWERIQRSGPKTLGPAMWVAAAPFVLLMFAAVLAPEKLLDFAYYSWFLAGWATRPTAELAPVLRVAGILGLASWLAVLAAGWASNKGLARGWWTVPLLILLLVDLWRVDVRYLQTAAFTDVFPVDTTTELLKERLEPGERAWALERTYNSNELMYFGIPTVVGTQKFLFSWYGRLVGGLAYENLWRRPVLWQLFDIRFLVTRTDPETPLLNLLAEGSRGGLYEVTLAAPHAFFPARVTAVSDTAEALRRTLALQDPGEEAVVESLSDLPAGSGTVRLTGWSPDELTLTAVVEREGLLFLSEVWAPGWRAYVDALEVKVYRTDTAFRGIVVPVGEHRIRFVYSSPGFRWGSRVSAAALLIVFVGIGVGLWRMRAASRMARGEA